MIITLRVFIFVLFLSFGSFLYAQLTIRVVALPNDTPPDDTVYIAGNFNNWDPGNNSYALMPIAGDTLIITFQPSPGQLQFKFTRGSWQTVEGTSNGSFIPNRIFQYTGGAVTLDLTIAGWEDLSGNHTAAPNVFVLYENYFIPQLNRTRRIWIYLPPDYETSGKAYPVLYMHDGQNLFDAFYSFAGEWRVDESLNDLHNSGDYGAIVVGIDNGGSERIDEYTYWRNPGYGGGDGELYADFLVHTLKPHIDSLFRTRPSREYTGIAGSSLGGNISLSAALEYQDVFSKVGLFSPAIWFSDSAFIQVRQEGIEEDMQFYFVAGDNESSSMVPDMMMMHDSLLAAGVPETNMHLLHHPDGAHSEWYWAREFPAAYEWLFGDLILNVDRLSVIDCVFYPNPSKDFLILDPHVAGDHEYCVYSRDGIRVHSGITVSDSIDISALPDGLYYITLKAVEQNSLCLARFVKQ